MSEVEARLPPSRGRSSTRGGRGGFGRGGPRGGRRPVNGTTTEAAQLEESLEDQGELGEMKKKYGGELPMLKDMFPDWTDVDLVFALQEADGDVAATVDHITQGNVSQFAEVKKGKDRARSKVKDDPATAGALDRPSIRGGRGRGGFESARGGRGRGSDRGRGGFRGGRGGHATTNGTQKDAAVASVPTAESTAWDSPPTAEATNGGWDTAAADTAKEVATGNEQSSWGDVVTAESTPAAASEGMKSSLIPEGGPKKSWASMFSKPPAVAAPAKQATAPAPAQPPPAELVASGEVPLARDAAPEPLDAQPEPESEPELPPPTIEEPPAEPLLPEPSPLNPPTSADGEDLTITPSKDPLTEENVEHLPDDSLAPATATAASTVGSVDTRNLTPLPGQQPAPIGTSRPPMGGYATSAYRATGQPGRSASFQRRVQEQQEAVVMPGHNAVDRAAVQFGSMGLNGEPGPDVDEDREEPETQQALQHSPPSQPRTSLPPAPIQAPEAARPGGLPTPKQAPGLPPASQQNQQQMQEATMAPGLTQDQAQLNANYAQYGGRYGQPGLQQESGAQQQQKQYDPFGQQAQQSQYDHYGTQQAQHQQQQPQQHNHSGFGGLSSAPNDYQSYYTSNEQQRNAYNQYYGGGYGQQQDTRTQAGQLQQDAGLGQQRSASGFGAGPNESAYAAQAQQQAQSRYGDAGSGQNTPNPLLGGGQQQQAAPSGQQAQQHSMHQALGAHQQQPQQQQQPSGYGQTAGFPYGHPYYQSPYQQAYQNQFGYSHQAGGGGYGGGGYQQQQKQPQQPQQQQQGGMYGAPGGYGGMGSHASYDQHSSSPANSGAFGQNQQSSMRSASGMSSALGSGLDDYGRSSMQSGSQQSSGFGGINDPFARSASGFGGQGGYGQQSMGNPEDSLKPYNDSKSGPSPALSQPGRPGSAANSAGGSTQSGLPPPQSHQSGFGGYGGFPSQGNQYGNLGGLGGHQQQGQSAGMGGQGGYGAYGAGGFGQTYGGYGSRGGWGSNYGAH